MKKLQFVVLLILSFSAATAYASPATVTLTSNPVFQNNCAKCHGKTAEGKFLHGPSLTSKKIADASSEDLLNIISHGKGHMPKFANKLTPEEIDALVHEVKALGMK
jgi:mono/diheme cytochrome c family protein